MEDKSVMPDYIYTVDCTRTQCYATFFFMATSLFEIIAD